MKTGFNVIATCKVFLGLLIGKKPHFSGAPVNIE